MTKTFCVVTCVNCNDPSNNFLSSRSLPSVPSSVSSCQKLYN